MIAQRPSDPAAVQRVRDICLALPEVTERLSHGEASWFIRGKQMFCQTWDHHHDDRFGFVCAAPVGVQAELVETEPDRFHRPPYYGGRGWIGVYLDVSGVDWAEIAAIVRDAYCVIAPPKLIAQLG